MRASHAPHERPGRALAHTVQSVSAALSTYSGGRVKRSIIRWAGKAIGRPVLVALAVVVTASTVVSFGVGRPASAAGVPLRQVDWVTTLTNDPSVTVDPT